MALGISGGVILVMLSRFLVMTTLLMITWLFGIFVWMVKISVWGFGGVMSVWRVFGLKMVVLWMMVGWSLSLFASLVCWNVFQSVWHYSSLLFTYIIVILPLSTCYKLIENSRPHVYMEGEIYEELKCLGLKREAIHPAYVFLLRENTWTIWLSNWRPIVLSKSLDGTRQIWIKLIRIVLLVCDEDRFSSKLISVISCFLC